MPINRRSSTWADWVLAMGDKEDAVTPIISEILGTDWLPTGESGVIYEYKEYKVR